MSRDDRGQSAVVGVALLLGITVVSLGILTASIGAVIDGNAAHADATRVAAEMDDSLRPIETTGAHRGHLSFSDGTLGPAARELRVLNESGVIAQVPVDALVFETEEKQVTFLAGAIVQGNPGNANLYRPPPLTASENGGVLVVGAPTLNGSARSIGASGGARVTVETTVSHNRTALGNGTYRVAIETATPGAWERYFTEQNATVSRTDFDGDGTESVVATFPGRRTAYLIVHDMRLEVDDG
ncbi:DUF7289 family protein [Haladaptatus sp. CMSO5]|uniref:DUF7289 family protein n=1 Tax=Haladaptatus sp. CMSO5 TaxID=3120514 RepID=UPI002FCDFC75